MKTRVQQVQEASNLVDRLEREGGTLSAPEGVYMQDVQAEMSMRGYGGVSSYGGGSENVPPSVEVHGNNQVTGRRGLIGSIVWGR